MADESWLDDPSLYKPARKGAPKGEDWLDDPSLYEPPAPTALDRNLSAAGLGNIAPPKRFGEPAPLTVPQRVGPVIDPKASRDRRMARSMAGSVFAEEMPSRTFGELAGDTYDRARIGARGVAGGLLEVVNAPQHAANLVNTSVNSYAAMLGARARIPMLPSYDWVRGTQAVIEDESKAIREQMTPTAIRQAAEFEQADGAISATGYLLTTPSEALGFAAEQAPQFLAAGLPGGVTGKLAGAGVFAGGQAGAQVAAENQMRVKLGQITQAEADALTAQAAATSGVVNTILPRLIPGGTVLEEALAGGKMTGLTRGRGAAIGTLGEGVTGGLEEALDQANQNEATGKPLTQGVGKAFALGSLLEAPMGAVAGAVSSGKLDTIPPATLGAAARAQADAAQSNAINIQAVNAGLAGETSPLAALAEAKRQNNEPEMRRLLREARAVGIEWDAIDLALGQADTTSSEAVAAPPTTQPAAPAPVLDVAALERAGVRLGDVAAALTPAAPASPTPSNEGAGVAATPTIDWQAAAEALGIQPFALEPAAPVPAPPAPPAASTAQPAEPAVQPFNEPARGQANPLEAGRLDVAVQPVAAAAPAPVSGNAAGAQAEGVNADDADMPESLRRWGQPQRERFGLAKAAQDRKTPSMGLNGVVTDTPDPQKPNSEFTPEAVMYQLAKYQEGLKTLDGAARSPNKGKFSPSDLVSVWTRVGQTEAFVQQSRAQNPELWAAYDARQQQVAKLDAGDAVLWNGDTPATVLRKFKNNWRIRAESGQEVLVPPSALAPATQPAATAPDIIEGEAVRVAEDGYAPPPRSQFSAADMRSLVGWSQEGGRMVRAPVDPDLLNDEQRAGLVPAPLGEVIGRTRWTGWPGPDGQESTFWKNRPVPYTPAQANAAFDKFEAGATLTKREQRFIDYAQETAAGYDAALNLMADEARGYEQQAAEQDMAELREQLEADIADADAAEAMTLADLYRELAMAGVDLGTMTPADTEPDGEYAARLWTRLNEARNGTDQRTEAGDPAQSAGGRGGREAGASVEQAFALNQPAAPAAAQEVAPAPSAGLFGAPSARDFIDAAGRARDARRNGDPGADSRMLAGDGELFAGARPAQVDVETGELPAQDVSSYGEARPLPHSAERGSTAEPGGNEAGRGSSPALRGQFDLFVHAPQQGQQAPAPKLDAARLEQSARLVRTGEFRSGVDRVRSLNDAAHILAPLRKSPQERFMVLMLDAEGHPLSVMQHTVGGIGESSVFPGMVLGAVASVPGVRSVVFGHNHPSGNATPSSADLMLDRRMLELFKGSGIAVKGSIILRPGSRRFTVYGQDGKTAHTASEAMPGEVITPRRRGSAVPMVERQLRKIPARNRPEVTGPQSAMALVREHRKESPAGVILLDNRNAYVGFVPFSPEQSTKLRTGDVSTSHAKIIALATEANATSAIVYGDAPGYGGIDNMAAALRAGEVRPLDAIIFYAGVPESLAAKGRNIGSEPLASVEPAERDAYFKRWSKGAPIIEPDEMWTGYEGGPAVFRLFHGTTADFDAFDRSRANPESDFGAGFYFSSTPDDVGNNYAGIGPDLENKIQREAERIAGETDRDYSDPEVMEEARRKWVQHDGATMPVFVRVLNPAIVGGPNETRLTFEEPYDEEADEYGEPGGTLVDFIEALRYEADNFSDGDIEAGIAALFDAGLDGEVALSDVIAKLKETEEFNYFTDDNGDLASSELIRAALERAGFDGIVDYTVDQKFGSQKRIGKAMAGMSEDTVHVIAFEPTQIKSSTGNSGEFNPSNPSVLAQTETLTDADLTPAEFASMQRQSIDRSRLQGEVSRENGERDADGLGLRAAVDAVVGDSPVPILYVRGAAGLHGRVTPEYLQAIKSQDRSYGGGLKTAGLYVRGFESADGQPFTVLFTDVAKTPERAAFTAAHEIAGHHGLRAMLGAGLDPALSLADQNPTVSAIADSMQRVRGIKRRNLAVEEALADLAGARATGDWGRIKEKHGVEVPLAIRNRVIAALDNFLRRLKALLNKRGTFSDGQVRQLLEGAWKAATKGAATMSVMDASGALQQVVFHGTPHTVDKFSLQKIGTGEGNAAYGWGIYFASQKDIAESYRKALAEDNASAPTIGFSFAGKQYDKMTAEGHALNLLKNGGKRAAMSTAKDMLADAKAGKPYTTERGKGVEHYQRLFDFVQSFEASKTSQIKAVRDKGNLYRVEVPEAGDLLDWDKPLSQQPEKVRAALASMGVEVADDTLGSAIYHKIAIAEEARLWDDAKPPASQQQLASEALLRAGIPGLRYVDGGNRSPDRTDAQLVAALEKYPDDREAALNMAMRGVYNTPKEKAKIREAYAARMKKLEKRHNYVIWDESAIGQPESALESTEGGSLEGALASAEPAPLDVATASGASVIRDGRLLSLIDAVKAAGGDLSAIRTAIQAQSVEALTRAIDGALDAMRPKPRVTGTKNAVTDAERQAAGRDPILREAVQSNEETVVRAMRELREDPTAGDEAVARLSRDGVEAISVADEAILLVHKTDLLNKREAAAKKLADPNASEATKDAARQAWSEAEAKIAQLDLAASNAGREWGRFGQFRQRMMREDFTLVALERKERARLERPLTPEESATVKAMAAQIAELQEKLDRLQTRAKNSESEWAYETMTRRIERPRRAQDKLAGLRRAADDARRRLRETPGVQSRNRQSGAVISPTVFADLATIGAYHVANGAARLADWVDAMRADVGDWFDNLKADHSNIFTAAKREAEQAPATADKFDATPAEVLEKIDLGNIGPKDVRKLIAAHVGAGLRGEAAVIEAAANDLGLAPDEVRALFIQSVPRTEQSLSEAKQELADLRTLVRLQAEIDRLEAGLPKPKPGTRRVDSPAVADRKRELAELRQRMRPVRDPEGRYQEMRGKQIAKRIAELQARIAAGDFAPRPRVPRALSDANQRAMYELDKAKESFLRHQFEDNLRKRTPLGKAFGLVGDTFNLARAMMTSFDLSAILRQGGFIAYGHPLRAISSIGPSLKAFVSEANEHALNTEITSRRNAPLYKKYGLQLTGIGAGPLTQIEEAYASRWLSKLPWWTGGGLVRGSGRAYVAFLNKLRADSFDAMVATLALRSVPTEAEGKAIANYINVATGRGKVGLRREDAAQALNTVFFAPRLVASRFQLLAGQPLYGGTARTRKLVTQEYARFAVGVSVTLALTAFAMGEDDDDSDKPLIGLDPRSADFLKIRVGRTYIDPMAGLAQVSTFLAREITGETVTGKGDVKPLRTGYTLTDLRRALGSDIPAHEMGKDGRLPFGSGSAADVLGRFLRTKLAPVPGAIVNVASGSNAIGDPVTPATAAVEMVTPMSFQNIAEVMGEHGIPKGTAITTLGLLGMGIQHRIQSNAQEFADFTDGLDAVRTDVKERLKAVPVEQWPAEMEALRKEYGPAMEGLELQVYKQDGKYGAAGEPRRDADGNPVLKSNRIADDYREASGATDAEQVHHVIPDNLARHHPLMARARSVGYDLDRASNLLNMPKKADGGEIAHRTSHPDYDAEVFALLQSAEKRLKKAHGSLKDAPKPAVLEEVRKIEAEMRGRIQRKDVPTKNGRLAAVNGEEQAAA